MTDRKGKIFKIFNPKILKSLSALKSATLRTSGLTDVFPNQIFCVKLSPVRVVKLFELSTFGTYSASSILVSSNETRSLKKIKNRKRKSSRNGSLQN